MYVQITRTMSLIRHYGWVLSSNGGRTGAVVSVADYGPRGLWFETWSGSPFVVALSESHLLPAYFSSRVANLVRKHRGLKL